MSYRNYFVIFFLALLVRIAFYLFNQEYIALGPHWDFQTRVGLALALSDFGAHPLGEEYEASYHIALDEAIQAWSSIDRGLVYVHLLIKWIFGSTSYASLQVLHIAIDATLVFPLMSISFSLSQNKAMTYVTGSLYAIFLPQVWLSIQPDYNVWLTTGYILSTWLFLRITSIKPIEHRWRSLALYGTALFLCMLVVNQVRSTIILLPIGMAAWWWAVTTLTTRSLVFPRQNREAALVLIGVGILVIGVSGTLNGIIRDEPSPVRSTFGHAFWTGVGQFENPHGVLDDDGSVGTFYTKETGIAEVDGTTGGVKYNAWLTKRAFQFIEEYPTLYASMVARRALRIVFPNMPFTVIADKPAYDRTPIELARTKRRVELQNKHGKISPTTIRALLSDDPFYVVGLFGRLALMLLLPLGGILFFVFSNRRALGLLAIIPLSYHVITLSPVYATPIILIPAYAAVLPVVAIGWWLALRRSSLLLRKVRL